MHKVGIVRKSDDLHHVLKFEHRDEPEIAFNLLKELMSKRQHHELEKDEKKTSVSAKRIAPLCEDLSEDDAMKALEKLSVYLGIEDLTGDKPEEGLERLSFVDMEEASTFTDIQKQKLVEAITETCSKIGSLMAQATRSQGTVLALRDLQVNWNLPEERRWTELGAWKNISRTNNQTLSRAANDMKKFKRKQIKESTAPKALSTIPLLELFQNSQQM